MTTEGVLARASAPGSADEAAAASGNLSHATPASGVGAKVLPVVLTIVLLGVLLPLAMSGTIGMVLAVAVAGMILVLTMFGLAGTATGLNVAALFFAPMQGLTVPGASFVTATDALIVVASLLLIPHFFRTRLSVPWQFAVGAFGFFFVGCVASMTADVPIGSLVLLVKVMLATVVIPLLFVWWAPRDKALLSLALAYVVGAVANVGYAIVTGPNAATARYQGLTEQPTAFGYVGLLAITLLPYVIASVPRSYRWMLIAAGLICAYSIWISGSRASLLVLILLAMFYPVAERSLKVTAGLAFLGIVAVANLNRLLDTSGAGNALSRLLGHSGAKGSNVEREKGLANAYRIIQDHPLLGHGFNFDVFLAHNIYAQVAAAMGALGILVFLFLLVGFVTPLWGGPAPYRLLAYPALAYIVAGPITPNLGSRYIGVLLALALVAGSMDRDEPPPRVKPAKVRFQRYESRRP